MSPLARSTCTLTATRYLHLSHTQRWRAAANGQRETRKTRYITVTYRLRLDLDGRLSKRANHLLAQRFLRR